MERARVPECLGALAVGRGISAQGVPTPVLVRVARWRVAATRPYLRTLRTTYARCQCMTQVCSHVAPPSREIT